MGEKSRRARRRREDLEILRLSLLRMNPAETHDFLCPLCLRAFDFEDEQGGTEAHIIPQSAGGTLTTFLCRTCNSDAGSRIDKWFGEYVHLRQSDQSIFNTRFKTGRIEINDVNVGGDMTRGKDGNFTVLIDPRRSDPKALSDLKQRFPPRTLQMTYPLLGKEREVRLGLLQAGYLMLVKYFGYVPAFQKSLDIVRQQLLSPQEEILNPQFSAQARKNLGVLMGIAEIDGGRSVFVSAADKVVFFPPAGASNFYDELPKNYTNASVSIYPFTGACPQPHHATGLIVGDGFLLWPDALGRLPVDFRVARLSRADANVEIMAPVTSDFARALAALYPTKVSAIMVRGPNAPNPPSEETNPEG